MKYLIKYRKGYKYQLAETYTIKLPIKPKYNVDHYFLAMDTSGVLTIKKGYAWDGCSGPTIDRKTNMRAGLVHDALCQLIRSGDIPKSEYHKTNQIFKKILKQDGMSRFCRWLYFKGVDTSIAAKIATGKRRKVYTAP